MSAHRFRSRLPWLFLLALCVGACGDDDAGPVEPAAPAVSRWIGTYTGEARFGAANGTWGNGGTFRLAVAPTGVVTVAGTELRALTYDSVAAVLRWQIADGNTTNGEVTFHSTLTSDFFFRDQPGGTGGRGFTGWIQRPGEGRLDYRGLAVP